MADVRVDDLDAQFALFFDTQRAAALRLAYVLCGDSSTAEDVVADAFARMYFRWKHGQIDDPRAYLRQSIVNEVKGGFRRLAIRRRAFSPVSVGEAVPSDDSIIERDRLRAALLALPPRQRAAVALRFIDDLSEADTAAALGVSVGTVKAQVSRGLERLRAALEQEGGDSE